VPTIANDHHAYIAVFVEQYELEILPVRHVWCFAWDGVCGCGLSCTRGTITGHKQYEYIVLWENGRIRQFCVSWKTLLFL